MPLAITQAHDPKTYRALHQPQRLTITMAGHGPRLPAAPRRLMCFGAMLGGAGALITFLLGFWLFGTILVAALAGMWLLSRRMTRTPGNEWLILDCANARHCLRMRDGSVEQWTAPRARLRLRRARRALFLIDLRRRRLIGHCLSEPERKELADLLARALPG